MLFRSRFAAAHYLSVGLNSGLMDIGRTFNRTHCWASYAIKRAATLAESDRNFSRRCCDMDAMLRREVAA